MSRTNIRPRRRLSDLYAKGKEVRFSEDGVAVYNHIRNKQTKTVERILESVIDLDGLPVDLTAADAPQWEDREDDIVVWVQPPNSHQREQALREAQAERSRAILRAKREDGSPEKSTTDSFVVDMTDDTLLEYVLASDENERREEAQRTVMLREEWKSDKDDPTKIGFAELQDSMRQWDEAGRPQTEEWQPLIDKDVEFGRAVSEETDRLREASRESLKLLSRTDMEERAKKRHVELIGNQAFMARYEREMLWAATRYFDNRDNFYWSSVEEMLEEEEYALNAMADIYSEFIQEVRDAKNAPRAEPGSASVEPPADPETSEVSTPVEPTE